MWLAPGFITRHEMSSPEAMAKSLHTVTDWIGSWKPLPRLSKKYSSSYTVHSCYEQLVCVLKTSASNNFVCFLKNLFMKRQQLQRDKEKVSNVATLLTSSPWKEEVKIREQREWGGRRRRLRPFKWLKSYTLPLLNSGVREVISAFAEC